MPSPDPHNPVTILGAGIVGICTALSLQEHGVPVTLVDRGAPGQETSMGNAGVVSPWSIIPQAMPGIWKKIPQLMFGYGRPLSIHPNIALKMVPWGLQFLRQGREDKVRATAKAMSLLCDPSIELYQRHLAGTGHEDILIDSAYVHAFRDGSRATLNSLDYRIRKEMGANLELVGQDALLQIEPALSRDFKAAVLIRDQARVRSPGRLGQVLSQKAISQGAKFKQKNIRQLRQSGKEWEIVCDEENLKADRVVVCLGAWSPKLLEETALRVPLMAERGYHVQFRDPGIELNNSVMDVDAKVVASSMEGGVRLAGQAEFGPVDAPPNAKRKEQLVSVAQSAFPGVKTNQTSFWMGRRPSFPDSLPMLGPVQSLPGLFLNFGHSHYGLMMAPQSGKLMSLMLTNRLQNADLSPFSPERF